MIHRRCSPVTCNFNTFFWAFRHLHNISQICELTLQAHPSLFFLFFFFYSFSCFLNLEYTSNLLSSLSSTVIYFPLDSNSPPTHFFFKKKENYFPLCVFNSSKLIIKKKKKFFKAHWIFNFPSKKKKIEYLITAYPFVVVVVVVVVYL